MPFTSIDILTRDRRCYEYEAYASHHLSQAFEELGIACRQICLGEGSMSEYMLSLYHHAPSMTLSFVDLLQTASPLCEVIRIPHLFWESESLSSAIHYASSTFGRIGYADRGLAERHNLIFLPHAIDLKPADLPDQRPFDVVLFADLVDCENKERTWRELFSQEGIRLLKEGVERCLQDPSRLPIDVALEISNSEHISLNDLIYGIEEYLAAQQALELIESFEGVRVDVFGEHVGNNWLRRLKNRDNIFLHAALPFSEYYEVLKLSKVLVRSQPKGSDASDPWLLFALKAGCFFLSSPTPYLQEMLPSDHFYTTSEEMREKVKKSLSHPRENVNDLWKKHSSEHTWLKRAYEIKCHYSNA